VADGFQIGRAVAGLLARPLAVGNGLLVETRFRVVPGEQLGLGLDHVGKLRLQNLGNALVVLLPGAPEQRLVRGILHQGVLKDIGRLRGMAPLVEQFGLNELRQLCCNASWSSGVTARRTS
jgi:hypothetical protein